MCIRRSNCVPCGEVVAVRIDWFYRLAYRFGRPRWDTDQPRRSTLITPEPHGAPFVFEMGPQRECETGDEARTRDPYLGLHQTQGGSRYRSNSVFGRGRYRPLKATTYPQFPRGSTLTTREATQITRRCTLTTLPPQPARSQWTCHHVLNGHLLGQTSVGPRAGRRPHRCIQCNFSSSGCGRSATCVRTGRVRRPAASY